MNQIITQSINIPCKGGDYIYNETKNKFSAIGHNTLIPIGSKIHFYTDKCNCTDTHHEPFCNGRHIISFNLTKN